MTVAPASASNLASILPGPSRFDVPVAKMALRACPDLLNAASSLGACQRAGAARRLAQALVDAVSAARKATSS